MSGKSDIQFDPTLGWRMAAHYSAPGVRHDSRGYRSYKEFRLEKEKLRIAAIGDSFTYGLGVENHETYAARLEELTGAEVMNGGVNGYGTDQAFLTWETELSKELMEALGL